MKSKEPEYKRCAICDYSNLWEDERREYRPDCGTGDDDRGFIHDRRTDEYHCMECAKIINETIRDDLYNRTKREDVIDPPLVYWRRPKMDRTKRLDNIRRKPPVTLPKVTLIEWEEDEGDELAEDEPALS